MQLIRALTDLSPDLLGGAVSVGNFDGVHRGHARIIQQLLAAAGQVNGPAIVFTFDPHPVRILRPDMAPPPLTWTDRKADLLNALGVDAVIAYPTDETLLSLSAQQFFQTIVLDALRSQAMVEGPNFFFGKNREGDSQTLTTLCHRHGIQLRIVDPIQEDSELISSSRIRQAIADGQVARAAEMLTQPYRIRGMVTHGVGRGAKLGFPTANLDAIDTLIPGHGVYAGRAYLGSDRYSAAIHIGPNLTFGEEVPKVEIHVIDFHGSLYGQPLEVDFLAQLRAVQPFDSVDALRSQLQRDIQATRRVTEALAQRRP